MALRVMTALLLIVAVLTAGCAAPDSSALQSAEEDAGSPASKEEADDPVDPNATERVERVYGGTWTVEVTNPFQGPSGIRTPPAEFRAAPNAVAVEATLVWESDVDTGSMALALRDENGAVLWWEEATASPATFELPLDAVDRATRISAYPAGPGGGVNVDFEITVVFTLPAAQPDA